MQNALLIILARTIDLSKSKAVPKYRVGRPFSFWPNCLIWANSTLFEEKGKTLLSALDKIDIS